MTLAAFHPLRRARRAAAFTLVEVTLALGIAVFALVVMFGLLNVGVSSSAASFEQTVAANILSSVAADLRSAPRSTTVSVSTLVYGLAVPQPAAAGVTPSFPALPTVKYLDASGQVAAAEQARYRLSVWTRPGADRQATLARVIVSWPPAADLTLPTGAKAAGSVETLVALDRN